MPILCLIAALGAALPMEEVERLARRHGGSLRRLAPDEAVEIALDGNGAGALAEAETLLADAPVDRALVPAEGRAKRVLLADMDSTMITIECLDELADFAGVKPEVAAITRRAMEGKLDFFEALKARVALLAGLPEVAIQEVIRERLRVMPGARTLVATMKAKGARTVLASGGFTAFTGHVARTLGFDVHRGNRLEVVEGRLTGRLEPPLLGADAKLALLDETLREAGLPRAASLAVGDGANDRAMLKAAGLGVAFHAHKAAEAAADVAIRHADLSALLYLQGYAREEFAAA